MKKLVLSLATIAMAACVQAASVNWVISGVTQPGKTDAGSGYVGYLFASAVSESLASTYSTISQTSVLAAIDAGKFDTVVGNAIATGTTVTSGNLSSLGIGSFGSGDSLTLYAVIFDASAYGNAQNYATTASNKVVSFTSSTGSKPASWTTFSSVEGQGWQAIPEPTSGMLLLVGGALLALKRKRA